MASLNQVSIELQVKGGREATQALKRYSDASDKVTNSVLNAAGKIERINRDWERASRLYRQGTLSLKGHKAAQVQLARQMAILNGMTDSLGRTNTKLALSQLKAAQETRENAAEQQRASQAYRQLMASINPTIAAQQRLSQGVQAIRAAQKAGVISTQEAIAALRQLRAAQDAAAAGAGFASRGLNRTGVVAQQAGYQVGDFFVQIQSGTNVMVAFGQQATQLVGTFAMFARTTRAAVIASGIGIFISIATAVGAAIMRMNGDMKTLEQTVQDVESSFNDWSSALDRVEDQNLDQTFGNMTESVRSLSESMVELNNAAALNNLVATLDRLEDASTASVFRQIGEGALNIGRFISPFAQGEGPFGLKLPEEVDEEAFDRLGFSMARAQYNAYLDEMQRLAGAGDIEGVTALIDRFMQDATDNGAELSMEGISFAQSFAQVALSAAEAAARMNGSAEAAEETADAARQAAEQQERMNALLQAGRDAQMDRARNERSYLIDLENQLAMAQTVLEHGRESVEVVRLRAQQEAIANNLTGEGAQRAVELAVALYNAERAAEKAANVDIASNIGAGANEAARLTTNLQQAVSALSALAGATISANIRAVGLNAQTRALQQGSDIIGAQTAGDIAQQRARLSEQLGSSDPIIRELAEIELQEYSAAARQAAEAQREFNAALQAARDTGGGGGGGGGGGAAGFESLIPGMEALAEAVRAANEQAQMFEQNLEILDDALQHGLITQQQYNEMVGQLEEAYGQATQAGFDYESAMQQIAETAKSAMGDAFMSIVDGSATAADAFKNMARRILAQAFELLVVQPIMDSLFGGGGKGGGGGILGAIFSANGNVFSNGNVVPFANGGIVSSPTMFPMRGSNVGVMGEAGPEAIMPLKRTRGGKLGVVAEGGGAGNVTVENHFHIAANGDDSVKRIIAQEAPRIAAMTREQVVDARRRGGAMKQAFG